MTDRVSFNKKGSEVASTPTSGPGRSGAGRFTVAMLPLVGLVAFLAFAAVASAGHVTTNNSPGIANNVLSGDVGQIIRFDAIVGVGDDLSYFDISVPTSVAYTINPSGHVLPNGFMLTTGSAESTNTTTCGAGATGPCIFAHVFRTDGSTIPDDATYVFRINVDTPAGTNAVWDDWRVVGVEGTGLGLDAHLVVRSVGRLPLGISEVIIHSPAGAIDTDTAGAQGTISQSQRINLTITVKNGGSGAAENIRIRLNGRGTGDQQEETTVFTLAAGEVRTFTYGPPGGTLHGIGYNFSSTTGNRNFNVTLSTSTSASHEITLNVVSKPDLVQTPQDTQFRFLGGTSCSQNPNDGAPNTTISASGQGSPTKSSIFRVRLKNTGSASAVFVDPKLQIVTEDGTDRTSDFTVTEMPSSPIDPPGEFTSGLVYFHCFKIETKTNVGGVTTADGTYNVTVTVDYFDENTNYDEANNLAACTAASVVANTCRPPLSESRTEAALFVDSAAPTITIVTMPGTIEFQRGGGASREIKLNVGDTHLDVTKVNLTLTHLGTTTRHKMSRIGNTNDFTVTIDFAGASFEKLGQYNVGVEANDTALNVADLTIGVIPVLDTTNPVRTSGPTGFAGGGNALLNQEVLFHVGVSDNFRVNTSAVQLVPFHLDEDGDEEELAAIDMTHLSLPAPFNGAGTYHANFQPTVSGVYHIRVRASDMATLPNGVTPQPRTVLFDEFYLLNVTSQVDLKVKPAGPSTDQITFPETKNVSQVRPALFGQPGPETNADPLVQLFNLGGDADTFAFRCALLPGSTLQGVTGCEWNATTAEGLYGAATPVNKASTVTVHVYDAFALSGGLIPGTVPYPLTGKSLDEGENRITVAVTVPPSARPGDVGKVQFTAFSKFFPSAAKSINLTFTVAQSYGVDADLNATTLPVDSTTISTKPGRVVTLPVRIENLGNNEANFTLTTTASVGGEVWNVTLSSTDPRLTGIVGSSDMNLRLGPIGSSGAANQSAVILRIVSPVDAASGPGVTRTVTLLASNATNGVSSLVTVTLPVVQPTVTGASLGVTASHTYNLTNHKANMPLAPARETACVALDTCTFDECWTSPPPGTAQQRCSDRNRWNFTLQADAFSTRNSAINLNIGVLDVRFAVESPDGVVTRFPMTLVIKDPAEPPTTTLVQGRNGTYQVRYVVLDNLGTYKFWFEITENAANADRFETPDEFFVITDPAGATPPTLRDLVVKVDGTTINRQGDGSHGQANYGSNVTLSMKLTDNANIGKARILAFVSTELGPIPASPAEVAMAPSAPTKATGSSVRNLTAVYTGTFVPTLPVAQGAGDYIFVIEGFDSMGSRAGYLNIADAQIRMRLADLQGPVFQSVTLTGQGVTGNDIFVEQNVPVLVDVKVTDLGEASPGDGVQPSSVTITITRAGTTLVDAAVMNHVGGADYNHTLDTTLLNAVGAYTITIAASDRSGAAALVATRVLTVEPNLAPGVTLTSPPLIDGVHFASATTPVTIQVVDANLDPAAANAIVVSVRGPGEENFTAVTPIVSGTRPTFTLTLPALAQGDSTIRVVATDALGLQNTTEFLVRVDTQAPSPVAISVNPADLGKTFRASASDPLHVAPAAQFLVTATDGGAGVGTVIVSVRPSLGGAARELTLASPGAPFALGGATGIFGASLADGPYIIGATVRDRVGNSFSTGVENVTVIVDSGPPVITTPLRLQAPLSVEVNDLRSGVRSVEVDWAASESGSRSTFALDRGAGSAWTGEFPEEATGTVFFLVRATDNVGNTAEARCGASLCRLEFGASAPVFRSVTVTPLQAGDRVRGVVNISWDVFDRDGGQVQVTVRLRDSSGAEKVLEPDATLPPIAWDTTGEREGVWTILLVGRDPTGLSANSSMQVEVRNTIVAAQSPLPSNVNQGGSLLLAYQVSHLSKTVRTVVAVLNVAGQTEDVQLYDDGTHGDRAAQDGTWSATYTPRLKGLHTVSLQVTYTDNAQSTVSNVGTFDAQGLPVAIGTPAAFFAVLLLGAVVVGLGVFGVRRWK